MSEEAAQVRFDLGKAVAGFNQSGPEGLRPFLAEDVVFCEPPDQPGAGIYEGGEAMIEALSSWLSTWKS